MKYIALLIFIIGCKPSKDASRVCYELALSKGFPDSSVVYTWDKERNYLCYGKTETKSEFLGYVRRQNWEF